MCKAQLNENYAREERGLAAVLDATAHTTISQACLFHRRTSASCLSSTPYPSFRINHAGTPLRHLSNHIAHLRPIPPTPLLSNSAPRARIRTTPPLPITYRAHGTPHNPAALPREQPHLTVTIRADAPSPPPYPDHASDVLRAAANAGRVSNPSPSVTTPERPPRVRPHCRRARSTTTVRAPAETRELLKKPCLQVTPAEPRTHPPAYSRHEIEVLSSAQQDLLLTPPLTRIFPRTRVLVTTSFFKPHIYRPTTTFTLNSRAGLIPALFYPLWLF